MLPDLPPSHHEPSPVAAAAAVVIGTGSPAGPGKAHRLNGRMATAMAPTGPSVVPLPQAPLSARASVKDGGRQLLPHEDTIRSVYKKHAHAFFEEIKEGFVKELTTLRKSAQKALARSLATHNEEGDTLGSRHHEAGYADATVDAQVTSPPGRQRLPTAPSARSDSVAALAARVERQQEDLKQLARHVNAEFTMARKAVLTPMWKERALQDIAQGELRSVCAEEVTKGFRKLAAVFEEQKVEAAMQRLSEAGPMPWETKVREDFAAAMDRLDSRCEELRLRADEGDAARAMLVECCSAIERRQSDSTGRLDALGAELRCLREERLARAEAEAERQGERLKSLEGASAELRQHVDNIAASVEKERNTCSQLQKQFSTCNAALTATSSRTEATARDLERAATDAQAARAAAEAATVAARGAVVDAAAASSAAAHARADAEAARGIAAAGSEVLARGEIIAAQCAVRLSALEGTLEDMRHEAARSGEAAERLSRQVAQEHMERADALEARIAAAEGTARGGAGGDPRRMSAPSIEALEARARGLSRLVAAHDGVDPPPEADGSVQDVVFAAAKLRAHLEFAENRITTLCERAESVTNTNTHTHSLCFLNTTAIHERRLEAFEGRLDQIHMSGTSLGNDLAVHAKRSNDDSAEHASRAKSFAEQLGALQKRFEGVTADFDARLSAVSSAVAEHDAALSSSDGQSAEAARQVAVLTERVGHASGSVESLRLATEKLSSRIGVAESSHDAVRSDVKRLSDTVNCMSGDMSSTQLCTHKLVARVTQVESVQDAMRKNADALVAQLRGMSSDTEDVRLCLEKFGARVAGVESTQDISRTEARMLANEVKNISRGAESSRLAVDKLSVRIGDAQSKQDSLRNDVAVLGARFASVERVQASGGGAGAPRAVEGSADGASSVVDRVEALERGLSSLESRRGAPEGGGQEAEDRLARMQDWMRYLGEQMNEVDSKQKAMAAENEQIASRMEEVAALLESDTRCDVAFAPKSGVDELRDRISKLELDQRARSADEPNASEANQQHFRDVAKRIDELEAKHEATGAASEQTVSVATGRMEALEAKVLASQEAMHQTVKMLATRVETVEETQNPFCLDLGDLKGNAEAFEAARGQVGAAPGDLGDAGARALSSAVLTQSFASLVPMGTEDGDETIGATEVVGMAAASAAWAAAMDAAADDERRKEEAAAAASRAQASEAAAAQADRQDILAIKGRLGTLEDLVPTKQDFENIVGRIDDLKADMHRRQDALHQSLGDLVARADAADARHVSVVQDLSALASKVQGAQVAPAALPQPPEARWPVGSEIDDDGLPWTGELAESPDPADVAESATGAVPAEEAESSEAPHVRPGELAESPDPADVAKSATGAVPTEEAESSEAPRVRPGSAFSSLDLDVESKNSR